MGTYADFYILHTNGHMELLGCTKNEYDGDFTDAKTKKQFRDGVATLLTLNRSEPGQWYWPWKNSKITDEVFVFKATPKWYNRDKGVLLSKVYCKEEERDEDHLYFAEYDKRYDEKYMVDGERGYYNPAFAEKIKLPLMK